MRLLRHCTAAVLALVTASGLSAQTPTALPAGATEYTVFLGGVAIGREQVRVARAGANWLITSTGQMGAPLNLVIDRFELEYTADWQPTRLHASVRQGNNRQLLIMTSFGVTTATNEITQNGVTNSKTDQISARSIVLPNMFYASYEALAARLAAITVPADLPVYVAPQTEIRAAIKAVTPQEIRVAGGGVIQSRIFDVTFQNPNGPLETKVTIDDRGRFLRLDVPAQQLAVYRSDIATVSTRFDTFRNPTDGDVTIPSSGFNIAGTLTMPPGEGKLKHPSIVLVAGSGPYGRDELVAGTPIFAQLAGALAQQGFAVLRYDKRGIGQSGGRSERATLQDYADDLNAAIKWMSKRRDFDSRRIAVVGHSEGGAVAMLAAAREKKIASVVLVAAPGSTGAALVLEQQKHLLEVAKAPEEERKAKIQLQEKIQQAVMTDTGWEGIPPELRAQAESTLFRSMLLFDPAKVMPKVKQPILIVQGDLDKQVFPHHADTLGELARARKKAGPVELVHLSGVNHLLVPATTGEVSEYASLPEKTISPVVPKTIGEWLKK